MDTDGILLILVVSHWNDGETFWNICIFADF